MVFRQFFFYSSEEIRMKVFLCLLLLAVGANCLYSDDSNVVDLNPDNFDKLVTNGDEVWIVEFFAPWCGHCQALTPQYDKAADALKGIVKVGAVDADEHKVLAGRFGVRGFPTIKIFGADKKKPEDYNGDRTASALVDAGLSAAKDAAKASLRGKRTTSSGGAKSSSSSKSSGSKSKSSGGGGGSCDSQCNSGGGSSKNYKPSDSKDVVELTDDNFDNLVLNSKDVWLVEFFAPWCGHCKNLAPEWAAAATELKGKVKLGALDATVHTAKAQEYGVKGYPTIKYFAPGSDYSDAADYDGGRTSDAIVSWALEKWSENASPPEVLELVGESVFKDACDDKQLCVVSVLPHIYDCQSSCRNGYLKTLKSLTEKYKQKNWGWVWSEAGAQPEVEEALEIGGFGYPALAVVNPKKLKYSLLRGSFSYDGINDFLRSLGYGKGGIAPIRGAQLPKVRSTDSWDGEDRLPPQEEEIDLSDVDLDEKDEL